MSIRFRIIIFLSAISLFVFGICFYANPNFKLYLRVQGSQFSLPPSYPTIWGEGVQKKDSPRVPVQQFLSLPGHIPAIESVRGFRPSLAWKYAPLNIGIHSASKASPAVDESGIYVGTDAGQFMRLDHSGKLMWSFFVGDAGFGLHATAVLDQDYVYFGAYNGFLYCLEKETGALVYYKKLGGSIGGSLVLHDDHLYISVETGDPNGFVVKVRAVDGEINWISEWIGEHSHSTPTLDEKEKIVSIGANNGRVYGFDLQTGETRWIARLGMDIKATAPLVRGVLYYPSWDEKLHVLSSKDGSQIREMKFKGILMSSLVVDEKTGMGYLADREAIYGISLLPESVIWRYPRSAQNMVGFKSTGALVRGPEGKTALLMPCTATELCLLDALSGKEISKFNMNSEMSSIPVVFGGRVFVATEMNGLQAIDLN